MKGIRRKEKAITEEKDLKNILLKVDFITIAMCEQNEPYLVSLNHAYDPIENCLYFHCAKEGKKIDMLKKNNLVWGQALIDEGYVQGECSHNYASVMFRGRVTFLSDFGEKKKALLKMIYKLDDEPEKVIQNQMTEKSITNVTIGRIDIEFMSGKKAKEVILE